MLLSGDNSCGCLLFDELYNYESRVIVWYLIFRKMLLPHFIILVLPTIFKTSTRVASFECW
jgi:hypothetical protein